MNREVAAFERSGKGDKYMCLLCYVSPSDRRTIPEFSVDQIGASAFSFLVGRSRSTGQEDNLLSTFTVLRNRYAMAFGVQTRIKASASTNIPGQ